MRINRSSLWNIGTIAATSIVLIPALELVSERFLPKKALDASHRKNELKCVECKSLAYAPFSDRFCDRLKVKAAAIYEKIDVQGASIAALTNDRTVGAYPVAAVGVEPQEAFSWGFKIGADYRLDFENWVVGTEYTCFKSVVNTPMELSYGQAFIPSAYVTSFNRATTANTAMFLGLQTGIYTLLNDFKIVGSRPTLVTPNLEMTTLFGVEANFLRRRQLSIFTNALTDTATSGYLANAGGYLKSYQRYSWSGAGPTIGLNSNWRLDYGITFFANASGALTYGATTCRSSVESKQVTAINSGVPAYATQASSIQNTVFQVSPVMHYMLGFHYETLFKNDAFQINCDIAYETSYYADILKTLVVDNSYYSENGCGLGLQGLVLQASLTF